MTDVPHPEHGTSHYVFHGQLVPPPLPSCPSPAPVHRSQQSHASINYLIDDYNSNIIVDLNYHDFQDQIAALNSELGDLHQEHQDLKNQVAMLKCMLQMDSQSVISSALSSSSPAKLPQKPVPQCTPTAPHTYSQKGSPFVTIWSEWHHSLFPSSPSCVPISEPTTPSGPCCTGCLANLASPSPCSPQICNTSNDGAPPSNTMLNHVFTDYEILDMKPQVLLLDRFMSSTESEQLPVELVKIVVPYKVISSILKAILFDKFDL